MCRSASLSINLVVFLANSYKSWIKLLPLRKTISREPRYEKC